MDTLHDLGGREGFGPLPLDGQDQPFHHDWEGRMWGIARTCRVRSITIDWFRHGLERMVPADYLTQSYFEKWCATYFALLIDAGVFTEADVAAGTLATPGTPAAPMDLAEVLAINRASHASFAVEPTAPPRFALGDRVKTRRHIAAAHTRLPAYARDRVGEVIAHHGAHVFPDEGAHGRRVADHLYTIAFAATELWGETANPKDSVTLDLWERYCV